MFVVTLCYCGAVKRTKLQLVVDGRSKGQEEKASEARELNLSAGFGSEGGLKNRVKQTCLGGFPFWR